MEGGGLRVNVLLRANYFVEAIQLSVTLKGMAFVATRGNFIQSKRHSICTMRYNGDMLSASSFASLAIEGVTERPVC